MSALLLFLFSYINDKHAADAASEINTIVISPWKQEYRHFMTIHEFLLDKEGCLYKIGCSTFLFLMSS